MNNLIYITLFLLGIVLNSAAASMGTSEEWKNLVKSNARPLFDSALRETQRDELLFDRKNDSLREAVDLLLFQYPPKKGGLYRLYKEEVYALLLRCIPYYSPGIEWSAPWNDIALEVLGSSFPQTKLPALITLVEIRRIKEFEPLYRFVTSLSPAISQENFSIPTIDFKVELEDVF